MVYEIVVTSDAEDDLNRFLRYLLVEKAASRPRQPCLMILKRQSITWRLLPEA